MHPSPAPATFASAHGRALIVKILLVVGAVVTALSLLTDALSLLLPPFEEGQELTDNAAGAAIALIGALIAFADVAIHLATIIFFLVWLYRAHGNLAIINPHSRLEHSRVWAMVSFFIPFVNLFVPYRAIRELWQKSGPPDEALLAEPSPPATFPVWWAFWILASVAGNVSFRLSLSETVARSTVAQISMAAAVLSILAAIFAYLVVDAIDKRQEETKSRLQLALFPTPPPPPTLAPAQDVVGPT